ncbi:23S rRNA (pseudouridine(1915)-N(3))-methyltransferase RlmH [Robertkochia marina]|uniref:Ribosomal RNA large subunit methyltransferase H n=1 Tax=Robertkochia marina TaxID=1227945 RepID=A0A4S3LZZ9_9FLAO|nr:23S rRNA (pseudouridine(1915)-N(3))-methyltransferase RlmH [Robertkochia marina]THD67488.1 23S rRNA (pseudouridine(1915)-N(3))-methyltransferase RlmH [Robertkochia marina]TRZ44646.1 23S rRNA (pseudouridine(1915)-N(3))-methyltransferase RlmH [Robertkochia marina]
MKIKLITIGKTDRQEIKALQDLYTQRLERYVNFVELNIPDLKNTRKLTEAQQKDKEGTLILKELQPGDKLVLLDENGKMFTSVGFSDYLQKEMNSGLKQLVFVIGGPYGFSEEVYRKAQGKISLSKMTFSHQMIRIFFIEQLYRGFTILKNEPYHHR